ncbi:hypothetical protein [Legionella maioricensis]|uniref:Uncharacterized protein n=1 Tax=Legionella maioricensis TaxID=2896528 RepID=A0A9X2D315_9GAMM|nr:hypothetical protein [Legionella maioricensis]MCL9685780.1 hypothetical protein [Legionella maioricensis]MCL9689180.1 hypothetical protein [Legionella maioricensis]
MKYISEFREILDKELSWQKSRIDCFAQMLLALFMVRSDALIESRYKRVNDFFQAFTYFFQNQY